MYVIPPLEITGAMFTSSNVSEPDATETVWASGGTYAVGDLRIRTQTHRIYESLTAHSGVTTFPENDTTNWLDVGPTNKWAMFDFLRNTATTRASEIEVVITPGERIDSIALLGLVANTVAIEIVASGSPPISVYSATEDLDTREVFDWYDYFFQPFSTKPSVAYFDIPPYTDAVITITITATSGDAECGACVFGMKTDIGTVKAEAESDVLNYSTVTRNFDGTTAEMVRRLNVPKTISEIVLDKNRVNRIRALRDSLNATPAVWAGIEDSDDEYFEALLILGFYKRFSLNLRHPDHAIISLELEEV